MDYLVKIRSVQTPLNGQFSIGANITVYMRDNIQKILPGIVVIGNTIARPVVAAGITYAIGRLFVKHFDTGAWLRETPAPNAFLLPNQ